MRQILLFFLFLPWIASAQNFETKLLALQNELAQLKKQEEFVFNKIEAVKLEKLQSDLRASGLPKILEGEILIEHAAMSLVYSEQHEQAKWVAHIILPDIIKGSVFRTNDFRSDPKVISSTAVEQDYFLKNLKLDSTYEYDGFGYDRGHLAPSADFRWSKKALSQSYYYSNMSPQLPGFNREIWAQLENEIRAYIYRNPSSQLYVVTGPVLSNNLPAIQRSINKVSIPKVFWKVVIDLEKQRGIGFLIPNQKTNYPLASFVKTIDEIELETGIDFYASLDDSIESVIERTTDKATWLPDIVQGNVEPIYPPNLPKNHFNTVQAKRFVGNSKKFKICGTVVDARKSRKGNVLINLDRRFPDQIFTIFINKEHIVNFSYDPVTAFVDQKVCVTGKVSNIGGTPTIRIDNEKALEVFLID